MRPKKPESYTNNPKGTNMKTISADEIEKMVGDVYPHYRRANKDIVNDSMFCIPNLDITRELVFRNSVRKIKQTKKFQCEERALTLLSRIRNDFEYPRYNEYKFNLAIGMAGGIKHVGLPRGVHMRLLAITNEGLVTIEPFNDSIEKADNDKFSVFNLWM